MNLLTATIVASAVASALVGGVFFASSVFVMRALATLPAAQVAQAMQRINATVIHPLFLGVFLGTAPLLAAAAFFGRHSAQSLGGLLAALLVYLVGSVGVTLACNVPRNNRLAASIRKPWVARESRPWTRCARPGRGPVCATTTLLARSLSTPRMLWASRRVA